MLRNLWNRFIRGRRNSFRAGTLKHRALRFGLEPLESRKLLSIYNFSHVCDPHDGGPMDGDGGSGEIYYGMAMSHFSVKLVASDYDAIKDATVAPGDFTLTKDGTTLTEGTDYTYSYELTGDVGANDVVTFWSKLSADGNLFKPDTYEITIAANSIQDVNDHYLNTYSSTHQIRITGYDTTFTVAMLPDTQHYVLDGTKAGIFNEQTKWIVDNINAENIVLATHMGDVVDTASNTDQWTRARTAMDYIKALQGDTYNYNDGMLPYGVCAGNHDLGDGGTNYKSTSPLNFPAERYNAYEWYVGTPDSGTYPNAHDLSHAQRFSGAGYDFLHINLVFGSATYAISDAITWAKGVIDAHPTLPVILSTHSYLNADATASYTTEGNTIFNNLVKERPHIFMVLCGHSHGAARKVSFNDANMPVYEILADYQEAIDSGDTSVKNGDGYLRLVTFDPDNNEIRVTTHSEHNATFPDLADPKNEFTVKIDFARRLKDLDHPFAKLTTPNDDASGDYDPVTQGRAVVDAAQSSIVIQLQDYDGANKTFGGIDDSTVTSSTVSMTKNGDSLSYNFSYDSANNRITLTPTSGNFTTGTYDITLNGGTSKIKDSSSPANELPTQVLTVVVDTTITQKTLLDKESTGWHYYDDGGNLGTSWREPGYSESGWDTSSPNQAELGYGDGGEKTVVGYGPDSNNKYVTTYFRHTFTIGDNNAELYRSLKVELLRDDGAVVYLNGHEICRDNINVTGVPYNQYAEAAVGGTGETTFFSFDVDPSCLPYLVNGTNVIAVEIHQCNATSTDISFDIKLTGKTSQLSTTFASGVLTINGTPFDDNIVLSSTTAGDATHDITLNGQVLNTSWHAEDVQQIWVYGFDGDDTVDLDNADNAHYFTNTNLVNNANTHIDLGRGNDYAIGLDYDELFLCSSGNDTVYGRAGDDSINAGDGDDAVYAEGDSDTVYGGAGNDCIDGGAGADLIFAEAGNDWVYSQAGDDTLYLGDGDDYAEAGDGVDILYGGAGRDYVNLGYGNDFAYGEDGNDTIHGKEDNDWLEGGYGDDIVCGWTGNDRVFGQDGNDLVQGNAGNDTLEGGAGNDQVWGDDDGVTGDDSLMAGDGNDTIYAGAGHDFVDAGAGDDSVVTGDGNDTIYGQSGRDTIDAGAGDDLVYGGDTSDSIDGNTGNDTIYGGLDDSNDYGGYGDTILGGAGNDSIQGDENYPGNVGGRDWIDAGAGNDSVYGGYMADTIYGGSGRDTLYGDHMDPDFGFGDYIDGGDNSDLIVGMLGDDTLIGGLDDSNGNDLHGDTIEGQYGNDVIYGDNPGQESVGGDDLIYGGDACDLIYGQAGQDTIYGNYDTWQGGNGDTLVGGDGDDLIYGDEGIWSLWGGHDCLVGGAGNDTLYGEEGNDTIDAGSGNDVVYGDQPNEPDRGGDDLIYGGDSNDTVYGMLGNDIVDGGYGDDLLYGNANNDSLIGGTGNDTLESGAGDDTVRGGAGNDTFVFSGTGLGSDKITETAADGGTDVLDFSAFGGTVSLNLGSTSSQTVNAGNLTLTLSDGSAIENVVGSAYADNITGNSLNNKIWGGYADDTIDGYGGDDSLYGEAGADRLYGGYGNDRIDGGDGNDVVYGGSGNDYIWGAAGNDSLFGEDGDDTIDAGYGNDLVYAGNGNDLVYLTDGTGGDYADGGAGNDTLYYNNGDSYGNFESTHLV